MFPGGAKADTWGGVVRGTSEAVGTQGELCASEPDSAVAGLVGLADLLLLALGLALLGGALALGELDLLKHADRTADREGSVLRLHSDSRLRRLSALAACRLANLLEGCVGHLGQCDCLQSLDVLLVGLEVACAQGTQVLEGAWTLELRQLRHLGGSLGHRLEMSEGVLNLQEWTVSAQRFGLGCAFASVQDDS